ncbi:MAG: hypothetical protein ABWY26_03115 [Microbacterium sp.]
MTVRHIVSAMIRRWYVPLAVFACVALAFMMMARDGGIYTTRTIVSFLRPAGTSLSPNNGATDQSVIAFAGAVVLEANKSQHSDGYSLSDAPYYGAGIREGALVELTNAGNQWVSAVNKAEIEVDIAGRTREWVESRQEKLVAEVVSIADELQEVVRVSPKYRIAVSVVPLTTQIDYISPSRGTQLAAGAAMLAVAILTAAWGSVLVDGVLSKRRSGSNAQVSALSDRLLEGSHS